MSILTLKALRERAGLSVTRATILIGTVAGNSTLRAWEVGKFKINRMHLEGICKAYGCTPEELAPYLSPLPAGRRGVVPGVLQKRRAIERRQQEQHQPATVVNGHGPPARLEARQKGKALPQVQVPAKVEVVVQPDGSVGLQASWQPGTPQGERLAHMAAEMLVNIR